MLRTIDDESPRVSHILYVEVQIQRLQTPFLAMRDRLPGGSDVCLGEEETAQPDLDVVEVVECRDVVQLSEAPREVGDPFGDTHCLVHFVLPPMRWDGVLGTC